MVEPTVDPVRRKLTPKRSLLGRVPVSRGLGSCFGTCLVLWESRFGVPGFISGLVTDVLLGLIS